MKDYINQGNIDTRSGFGAGLLEAGQKNGNVVALCADLVGSLKMASFIKEFPERFFQCGIAEANMVGVAAGMALSGKIPFIGSFANFVTARVFDQVRQSIAYSECNVKIAASHAGVTLGEDGATHQTLEDIGMMRMLPGMVVLSPCDYNQTKAATLAAAEYEGPVYLRFGRPSMPNFTPVDDKFEIGKAIKMEEGSDVTILATGHLVWQSVLAAQALESEGVSIELINIATIKPLDEDSILESVAKTHCCVVAEEHEMYGGLGEMIAGLLARRDPVPMEQVAVNDRFGQSGTPVQLLEAYGLDAPHIVEAVRKVIHRK
ncbi:MAG: transketolase family protein [Bacteroidales bacterium]|jgi:transketolase|nr:transketolase family protein [Bacteroidales bacterium]MCI2121193.1 transketolase family protein [Bacteroidales bacterium]MCI2145019.1 transketolase family protein [Bacteroidales bacterium]